MVISIDTKRVEQPEPIATSLAAIDQNGTQPSVVTMIHYADPFSPWSRGFQPVLARLRSVYGEQLKIEYKMGGMARNVSQWFEAMELDEESIAEWTKGVIARTKNPISNQFLVAPGVKTTWLASLAFVAASKHHSKLAIALLRRMTEAFQIELLPNNRETIARLADEVGLNGDQIVRESFYESTISEFAWQRNAMERKNLRFDNLLIEVGEENRLIENTFSASEYEQAIDELAPGLIKSEPSNVLGYINSLSGYFVSAKEISEVFDISFVESEQRLERLAESGVVTSVRVSGQTVWKSVSGESDADLLNVS